MNAYERLAAYIEQDAHDNLPDAAALTMLDIAELLSYSHVSVNDEQGMQS